MKSLIFTFIKTNSALSGLKALIMVISSTACKKEAREMVDSLAARSATTKSVALVKSAQTVHAGGSIQAAVDAAGAGGIVNIEPGVYKEAIVVNNAHVQL